MTPDLHDLDADQQRAVGGILAAAQDMQRHLHVIIAMAGSGKTRSLTALLRELIGLGESPDSLVAISFTNRAANELKSRIRAQVCGADASQIHSMTFHKFCRSLLPGGADRTIIDEYDARGWFSEWVAKEARRLRCDWGDVFFGGAAEMVRLVSLAKSMMYVPRDVEKLTLPDLPEETARTQLTRLATAWAAYETWKDDNNTFDPNDLQWRLWLAMRADPSIVAEARQRFTWMTVDEAQDLSPLQMHLARELAGRHLVMVGDINQSIYGFRGARRAMLAAIAQQVNLDGRRVHVYWLPRNYRATKLLVRRGNKVLGLQEDRRLLQPMRPTREPKADVKLRWYPDPLAEAEAVAKEISQMVQAGVPGHEIVILSRVNARSALVATELAEQGVSFTRTAKYGFWGSWPVEQALAYLRLSTGVLRPEDLAKACKAPRMYWSKDLTAQLVARLHTAPNLRYALQQPFAKRQHDRAALHMASILSRMERAGSPREALDVLYAAESSDFKSEDRETFYTAGASRRSRIDNSRAEALDQLRDLAKISTAVPAFLDYAESKARMERMLLSQQDKTREGYVSIMSIHRVKGLEFDHVYLIGMGADQLPHPKSEPDEEARVFYVAQTRAREHLTISWTGDHPITSASPFLGVWPDLTTQVEYTYSTSGGTDAE